MNWFSLFQRAKDGGFTIHIVGEVEPVAGYMVSLFGREQRTPWPVATPASIACYANLHWKELCEADKYLGAWRETTPTGSYLVLDVSRNVLAPPSGLTCSPEEWAKGVAKSEKQRTIYDVVTGKIIAV